MEEQPDRRRLDLAFVASSLAVTLLVLLAIAREAKRPRVVEQRIVPALSLVDRCESCHDAARHSGAWTAQHPVERFGCTTCHGGQGLATTADAAHRAHLDWERPLFTRAEREANCGTCHLGTSVPASPSLGRGRALVASLGCAGCHELADDSPPNLAPELDGLSAKVTPGWVRAWLADPAQLDPAHKMPRFALSGEQIEALTAFLFSVPGAPIEAAPPEGDAERGKLAIGARRCVTCHRFEGRGGTLGTNLDHAGAKVDAKWLFAYLTDTHRLRPRSRMPGFKLPADEAADIVAYAKEQWVPDTEQTPWAKLEGPVRAELASQGKKAFSELGCRGCHGIAGVPFVRVGGPLTGLGDKRVSDRVPIGSPVPDIPSYVATKVLTPRALDGSVASKMPAFALSPEDAAAIGIAVGALHAKPRPAGYIFASAASSAALPGGATGQLVERYRCLVCHRVGGVGGDVSRVPLDGEGSRVNRAWLEQFLRSPTTLRMDQAERMPILGLSETDAARLAAWMETMLTDARIPDVPPPTDDEATRGKKLYAESGCASCHLAEGAGTMKGPVLDGARERLQFAYVVAMLRVGNAVVPELRHPPKTYPPDDARALAAYVCSLTAPK